MDLKLETDRLSLQPLTEDDVDLGITLFTDETVCQYIGGTQTETEIRLRIDRPMAQVYLRVRFTLSAAP